MNGNRLQGKRVAVTGGAGFIGSHLVRKLLPDVAGLLVLDNLHRKGWVTRERDGRAWRYSAAISRHGYAAQLMNDALSSSADPAGVLAQFVEQIDADEALELARVLDQALARRRGEATE